MANFTRTAIKSTFLKLLNQRPLGQITDKDIVEDCGINRNSFYYHFEDLPALIEEIIGEQVQALIRLHKCACFGPVIDWLNGGMKDDIADYFRRVCTCKRAG